MNPDDGHEAVPSFVQPNNVGASQAARLSCIFDPRPHLSIKLSRLESGVASLSNKSPEFRTNCRAACCTLIITALNIIQIMRRKGTVVCCCLSCHPPRRRPDPARPARAASLLGRRCVGAEAQFRRAELLGLWVLCLDGRTRRGDDPGLHPQPGAGRREAGAVESVALSGRREGGPSIEAALAAVTCRFERLTI